jgi:hypothetical protein
MSIKKALQSADPPARPRAPSLASLLSLRKRECICKNLIRVKKMKQDIKCVKNETSLSRKPLFNN